LTKNSASWRHESWSDGKWVKLQDGTWIFHDAQHETSQ
jgi:hypothetical protein